MLGLKPPVMQLCICVDVYKHKLAGQGWFNALRRKVPLEKALHTHTIIMVLSKESFYMERKY